MPTCSAPASAARQRRTATSKAARAGSWMCADGDPVTPFVRHRGKAAALPRRDVDTDQIIPKQFLKGIDRTGFGASLFFDWRADPDFELNRPEAQGAEILVTG